MEDTESKLPITGRFIIAVWAEVTEKTGHGAKPLSNAQVDERIAKATETRDIQKQSSIFPRHSFSLPVMSEREQLLSEVRHKTKRVNQIKMAATTKTYYIPYQSTGAERKSKCRNFFILFFLGRA